MKAKLLFNDGTARDVEVDDPPPKHLLIPTGRGARLDWDPAAGRAVGSPAPEFERLVFRLGRFSHGLAIYTEQKRRRE